MFDADPVVLGKMVFYDRGDAEGLNIRTAGFPSSALGEEGNLPFIQSPGADDASGEILFPSSLSAIPSWEKGSNRFAFSQNLDASEGQSGSGVWHTVRASDWASITDDDDVQLIVGVLGHSAPRIGGVVVDGYNSGVLITPEVYAKTQEQIARDYMDWFAAFAPNVTSSSEALLQISSLPQNTIVGSSDSDFIIGTGRNERFILEKGGGGDNWFSFVPFFSNSTPTNTVWSRGGDDIVLGGEGNIDRVLICHIPEGSMAAS